nr:hypothetical protein [Cryobacterium sp. Sr8]
MTARLRTIESSAWTSGNPGNAHDGVAHVAASGDPANGACSHDCCLELGVVNSREFLKGQTVASLDCAHRHLSESRLLKLWLPLRPCENAAQGTVLRLAVCRAPEARSNPRAGMGRLLTEGQRGVCNESRDGGDEDPTAAADDPLGFADRHQAALSVCEIIQRTEHQCGVD